MAKRPRTMLSLSLIAILLVLPQTVLSASLPATTQEILKQLKLEPSILGNLDKELEVPKDWVEKAKKEGKLRMMSTGFEASLVMSSYAPFKERYPFIALDYSSPSHEVRAVKTLVAYKSGRILTDILHGVGGTFYAYKEANALEDLRDLPNLSNVPAGAKDPEGLWVGKNRNYYCMAFNPNLVKREDVPKRWEDFLTNPRWRGGNLALANRPQLWAIQLWKAKGEKWVKNFITRIFAELKPQLRKEDLRAVLQLLGAGEFHAIIPAAVSTVAKAAATGAPIAFACPEPAPTTVNDAVILKGSPNLHAAKIFMNWHLSREGQIAQYAFLQDIPVHKDLGRSEFVPFADQVIGKESAFRDPVIEVEVMPKLEEYWNNLWLRAGGSRR